ncbi:MAG: outer membrane protein assembly factor BamD [Bacteroidetes bacterium]|nr:outer membrane protein assembly factor BamD [Bacteroidota bacterium]
MFKKYLINIFVVIFSVLMLSSCGEYQKLLKSPDYEMKLTKALEYYENDDFARAEALLEELTRIYQGTDKAEKVFYYYARCFYGKKDYHFAGYYFGNFAKTFPQSKWAEECNFLNAYCYYLESPSASLDQADTNIAIESLILFIKKFPTSAYVSQCNGLIDEMRDKLVEKSYISAKLYYEMGQYKASITALNNSLADYPETRHKEELLFLILKSNYRLATNSVLSKQKERFQSTVDQYFALINDYPETVYMKEAKRYYDNSLENLK